MDYPLSEYVVLHSIGSFLTYLVIFFYQISTNLLISKPRKVTHGVPQVSVFDPLLFNINLLPLFKIIDKYPTIDL